VRLLLEALSESGNDGVNFVLDITAHRRRLEDPAPVFCPPLKMVGVALQVLQLGHPFVRVVIPAEEPFVARGGELKVDQCVGIALGGGIVCARRGRGFRR